MAAYSRQPFPPRGAPLPRGGGGLRVPARRRMRDLLSLRGAQSGGEGAVPSRRREGGIIHWGKAGQQPSIFPPRTTTMSPNSLMMPSLCVGLKKM